MAIAVPLIDYNERNGPKLVSESIALLLKSEEGETVGGLWGRIAYDWLFVELLAVPERMRGQRLGAALMAQAERIAASKGCVGVWLDTFSFQSRGFYERIGYAVFGAIDEHPIAGARFFMSKRL